MLAGRFIAKRIITLANADGVDVQTIPGVALTRLSTVCYSSLTLMWPVTGRFSKYNAHLNLTQQNETRLHG